MKPLFIATERFSPSDGERWYKFVEWSGLTQLTELVSLDSLLCPPILADVRDEYWPHIVNENFMLAYFTDLDFLKSQLTSKVPMNLLCVVRNPESALQAIPVDGFEFVGYDLVELRTGISSLSNCGGFQDVFANSELSAYGLLTNYERVLEVAKDLKSRHPGEPHADCDVWVIFRAAYDSVSS